MRLITSDAQRELLQLLKNEGGLSLEQAKSKSPRFAKTKRIDTIAQALEKRGLAQLTENGSWQITTKGLAQLSAQPPQKPRRPTTNKGVFDIVVDKLSDKTQTQVVHVPKGNTTAELRTLLTKLEAVLTGSRKQKITLVDMVPFRISVTNLSNGESVFLDIGANDEAVIEILPQ